MGLSPIGGSSGCKIMSTISPRAPFATSRSVSMLLVTITFIPFAISNVFGRSLRLLRPSPFFFKAATYLSVCDSGRPFDVSSALQTYNLCLLIWHHFLTADAFHSFLTACLGVTNEASFHG